MAKYSGMSMEELQRQLEAARRARALGAEPDDQTAELVQDLQVHQIELEMQNLELRQAHAELAASTARYADLYDSAPIPYFTFDERGLVLDINLTGAALLGRERAEILGLPFHLVAKLEQPADFIAHLRRCFGGADRVVSEISMSTPAAGLMAMQLISRQSRGADGAVVGCRTAFMDVSERKRAAEILQLFGDLALQIGGIKDASFAIDELARMLVPGVADLSIVLLFGAERFEPRVAAAHADPQRRPAVRELERVFPRVPGMEEIVARVASTGRAELMPDLSQTFARARGEKKAVARPAPLLAEMSIQSLLVVPLTARARVLGVLALATADSGRRFAEVDLALAEEIGRRASRVVGMAQLYGDALRATQTRDEILALVSHDLGGTAAAIALAAAALLERKRDDDGQVQVELIRRSAESMQHMVRDLLDTTLIEMGQLRISRTQVPVADLAREAIELVRPALEQAGVGIVVDAPAGLEVLADRERMRQVIVNLVSNALRFSDRGAVIRLGVCEDGDRVQFTLTDEGPGIPAADRERVFEAFWHGEGSQSTGLGLAIAKRIMDVHGERIWAESSPSGGAALVFTLPRARPERSASDR